MSDEEKDNVQDKSGDKWDEALANNDSETALATDGEGEQASQGADNADPKAGLAALEENLGEGFAEAHPDIDIILDIPVKISMEVGSTEISIRNLLHLNQGSVVELDRFAGEPLDVLVNGTLIAHGEVVVVNEKFGIRLTDILSATERLEKIR